MFEKYQIESVFRDWMFNKKEIIAYKINIITVIE